MKPTAHLLRPRVSFVLARLAPLARLALIAAPALGSVACVAGTAGSGTTEPAAEHEAPTQDAPAPDASAARPAPTRVDGDSPTADAASPTAVVDPAALPAGCDPTKLPAQDACTVHEALGVFVSSSLGTNPSAVTGSATVTLGTRTAPLATLRAAIDLAHASHRRVYACAESYAETLTIVDGVSIFGNLDCANGWRVAAAPATVFAPSSPAASATDIKTPTRIEGLSIRSPHAVARGASSFAFRAVRAPALTLVDVTLSAGRGAPGQDGDDAIQLVQTGAIDGAASMSPAEASACIATFGAPSCNARYGGGHGGVSQCSGAAGMNGGVGGKGGKAGQYEPDPSIGLVIEVSPSEAGFPALSNASTAAGAAPITPATAGAQGTSGVDGASAASIGVFSDAGYAPADGAHGTNGAPGQGGGGGRAGRPMGVLSTRWYGSSGSGGGAGGCPGLAGTPGRGGGASVALLAIDSPLRVESSVLSTDRGGAGGRGTIGSEPTPGGAPGVMFSSDPLTGGARGGRGGRAGVSGHGAGGPSIVVVSHGAAPTLVGVAMSPGAGGAGQPAVRANERQVSASAAGHASATYAF